MTIVYIAQGRIPQAVDLSKSGEVSMVIQVPRGGLAAFERDPLVGAFLENGAIIIAEFEDAAEADLLEAKLTGRPQ